MNTSVAPDARFRPHPRVRVSEVAGEAVLLDLDRGEYFALNPTGRRVWELATRGETFSAAVEALEREFDASRAALETDAAALLEDLQRAGLIVPIVGQTPADSGT